MGGWAKAGMIPHCTVDGALSAAVCCHGGSSVPAMWVSHCRYCCLCYEPVHQVGVEHLLRDINDPSVSTLANQVRAQGKGWGYPYVIPPT